MNGIDLFFILLVVGSLLIGIFEGTIRLAIAIIVLYVSIVLASLYFQPMGEFLRVRFHSTQYAAQLTGFALILIVSFVLLLLAGLYTFRYVRMPSALEFLDRIIGSLLGLLLGGVVLGMLALLMRDIFVYQSLSATMNYPIIVNLENSTRSSLLIDIFHGYVLPVIYNTLDPFLPPEANIIFKL